MNTLRIKVNGNTAELIDGLMPASGERKFSQFKFIFNDEWNSIALATVTMFFSKDNIVNQAVTIVDGSCTVSIPPELTGYKGTLFIGLTGAYSEDGTVQISTHLFPIRVGQGPIVTDKANTELFQSILDAIADMVRRFALLSDFNALKNEIINARDGEENLLAKLNKIIEDYQAEDTNIKNSLDKKLDNKDNVINSGHIISGAVTTDKIYKGAVTTNTIADGAVTTEKLSAGSVTMSKIANNSVSNGHLMDKCVNENKLADEAVTTSKLADNSVTVEKIANNAVTTDKIGLQAVTFSKIAENAVQNKHIANGSIKESKIADGAVTKAKLSDELLQLINLGGGSSGSNITDEQLNKLVENKEDITNKITAFDSLLTDKDKYPTAIAVMNYLKDYYYDANEIDGMLPDGGSIPNYIKAEAERVATNVQSVRTGQSFTFAGFSDAHIAYSDASKTSVLHAGMGLKCIREIANVDLVAHFGDYINGGHSSTKTGSIEEYKTYHKAMYDGCNGVDSVWLQGNHDANYQGGDTFTLDEMYGYIGSNNKGNHNVEYGHENQLYGFIDYPTKRLRVIYLNSSDGWKTGVSDVHANWLSDTAFDFSDKSDKANWGIVIFIHIPVTFTDNAKILTAINNYSGEAEIIGIFHGHCHNFRTDKVSNKQIWQIGIPELCVGRNNEYAHSTDESYSSIFGEFDSEGNPVHYNKVSNTAQDTSFNIVTIDRANKKIYCHNFGAGYDRTIDYGESGGVVVNYSITNNLTNVSTNNSASTVQSGSSYTANLTVNDGCVLNRVTVTMGGTDVTSTTYSNGIISVAKVTGNVVVTAVAVSTTSGGETTTYTNLFDPTADGFADLTRFSSSGDTEGSSFLSNYISFAYGDVIRVRCPSGNYTDGVGANHRVIRFYNSSKTLISDYYISTTADGCLVADADGLGFTFTCNANNLINGGYFRVCGNPNGKYFDFVITRNELINGSDEEETVVNYTITNNLTNVTSNNTVTTIEGDSSYTATLTANDGYNIENVTITMGGIDITSTVYSNGVITISGVTGNVEIIAIATKTATYTNLFSSTDADFADAVRFNSSGGTTDGSGFVSGYISAVAGDTIYVRCPNGDYSTGTGTNIRNICTYDSSKKLISALYPGDTTIDADGAGFSYKITDSATAYVRVAGHPNGNYADFVVTKNEIIE